MAEISTRLDRVGPLVRPRAISAAGGITAFATGIRREFESGRDAHSHGRVVRGANGRRLRASLYTGRTRSGGPRRPEPNPILAGGWLPAGIKLFLVFLIAGGTFLGSSSAYINFAADLPDAHAIAAQPLPEDTHIYAGDGKTLLADLHPEGVQHYYEPLTQSGKLLPEATVAIEDANFYHEPGIDVQGMVRAAWVDYRQKRAAQGASTITQQLVKLRLLDSTPTIDRKIKEAVLALQVEHTYSKQQILEQYLNTVHYGNNSQGSLAASRIYFHKETKDLDLAQASMLAGIPQSPLYNSPINNWDQAKSRQRSVLDAMVRNHYVTLAQADLAYAEDLRPPQHMFTPTPQVLMAPGFTYWIIDQLTAKYGQKTVLGGGLNVVTTLNPGLQAMAEKAIVDNVRINGYRGFNQGALVSIDPRSGGVMAMVGAADSSQNGGQYNMALQVRNPGSSFKIFTYTAAIASGKFSMTTPVVDSPITVDQPGQAPWKPLNYDKSYRGTCQLQQCMGNSLNVPAVKVELGLGVPTVVAEARNMGAPPFYPTGPGTYNQDVSADSFGPSLTLGGYGESVLQMATAASVLGAQGMLRPPYSIQSITSSDGTQIYAADPAKNAKQVLDPRVAYIMETIMSDDNNRAMVFGRGTPLTLTPRRVGAKTGTTDNFTDGWTLGYTPSLATAVWVGNPNNSPMAQGADGVFVAAPAWHNYMASALDALGRPVDEWFSEPPGLNHSGGVLLLPGTSAGMAPPALPSYAHTSSPPSPSPSPKPGG